MAGGGIKGGTSYGSTDELGFKAVENITHSYELHATALHLLGIDHEKLTFYHNGLQQRLTGLRAHSLRRRRLDCALPAQAFPRRGAQHRARWISDHHRDRDGRDWLDR
jgi:hypothetical protein